MQPRKVAWAVASVQITVRKDGMLEPARDCIDVIRDGLALDRLVARRALLAS
mgnify:CR=1 FL=1